MTFTSLNKLKAALLIFACLLIYYSLPGQNLIPNPSFEEFTSCPTNHATPYDPIKTTYWFSPTRGTPDLFSDCALYTAVSVPSNFVGMAYPAEGRNYVGMYMGNPSQTKKRCYREYLSCKLKKTLKKDQAYEFTFYAKPATSSNFHLTHLSFAFSDTAVAVIHDNILELPFSSVQIDTLEIVNGWYKIRFEKSAQGGEAYFTIGDFISPHKDYFNVVASGYPSSKDNGTSTYYLFDNFSLVNKTGDDDFLMNQIFSLEKLYFDFDSFNLSNEACSELKLLSEYMINNQPIFLNIYGNADKVGTDEYNDKLSTLRALAVKNRLIELGINPKRVKTFSNGKRKVISTEDSLNRRTEFLLYDFKKLILNTEE